MVSQTLIPAGYRLTIVSWENDADNYKNAVLEGLSEDQTRLYVQLAQLCERCDYDDPPGFANMYDASTAEIEGLEEAVGDLVESCPYFKEGGSRQVAIEYGMKVLKRMNLLGDEFFTRVTESIKVERDSFQITLENVTTQFVNM